MLSVLETKAKMKGKPVIVSLEMDKPTIMSEFEGSADAILVNFGVQNPSGLGYHQLEKPSLPLCCLCRCRQICVSWRSNSKMFPGI